MGVERRYRVWKDGEYRCCLSQPFLKEARRLVLESGLTPKRVVSKLFVDFYEPYRFLNNPNWEVFVKRSLLDGVRRLFVVLRSQGRELYFQDPEVFKVGYRDVLEMRQINLLEIGVRCSKDKELLC